MDVNRMLCRLCRTELHTHTEQSKENLLTKQKALLVLVSAFVQTLALTRLETLVCAVTC